MADTMDYTIMNNSCAAAYLRLSGFRPRSTDFQTMHYYIVLTNSDISYMGTQMIYKFIITILPINIPAHQMSHSLYSGHEPFDFE